MRTRTLFLYAFFLLACVSCTVQEGIAPGTDEYGIVQVRISNSSVSGWIIVDGVKIDKSIPDTFKIQPGLHEIRIITPGYRPTPVAVTLTVESGQWSEVEFTVQEIPSGDLEVITEPPGAEVMLDSLKLGITPISLIGLSVGPHTLQIYKSGYRQILDTIEIQQNKQTKIIKKLSFERVVVVEDFSNTGCPPCPEADARIGKVEQLLDSIEFSVISYHPNFPSPSDPLYQLAPDDIHQRIQYYQVFSTPSVFVNGEKLFFLSYDELESNLISRIHEQHQDTMGIPILEILVEYRDPATIRGILRINNRSNTTLSGHLFAAVVQKELHFSEPPGTNGQKDFFHIFHGFLQGMDGQEVQIHPKGILEQKFDWNPDESLSRNWQIIVFFQNLQGRILQSAILE
jgi:thiol-disulfide isomerase/thioredoxin